MKWMEYLKLIPKGLKNPKDVMEGIVNAVKFSHNNLVEDEQDEIIRRRLICAACPNMSKNKEGAKEKGFDYCTLCSCPILTKTAALGAECGAGVHNERHPGSPLPLLWERYKNN